MIYLRRNSVCLSCVTIFVLVAKTTYPCDGSRHPFYRSEYTAGRVFYRVYAGLTAVPGDLPPGARSLFLYGNDITRLPAYVFQRQANFPSLRLLQVRCALVEHG